MTLRDYISSLEGKRVSVIGFGISNRPLVQLLAGSGCRLTVRDRSAREALGDECDGLESAGVRFVLGEDYLEGLDEDVIFRTPALLPDRPQLAAAAAAGSLVTSEMEVFFHLCPCRVIAVTGSDGKTTTTTLISELLKAQGYRVWLGGNIGHPLLAEVDGMGAEDLCVLELSSFQLHSMRCAPDVAVITNLSPNHLDIHSSYEDYILAKKQIFANQNPAARLVLNADNAVTAALAGEAPSEVSWFSRRNAVSAGCYLDGEGRLCRADGKGVLPAAELRIPGDHNVENALAALAATEGLISDETAAAVLRRFAGVPHRLETVCECRGVRFINDSIASSPNRTIAGLSCFSDKLILIAGGKDKGIPFDALGPVVCEHVKTLILTGPTAQTIRAAVEAAPNYRPGCPTIRLIEDFRDAVIAGAESAGAGDVVLLSPACTSFDRFRNFEERGDTFKSIVKELTASWN